MFIECFTNNGKPYLRLVRSVRVAKPDGRKVSQKQVVCNIGPLDRYDDGAPDYVQRLKKSYKDGSPLIPDLLPYVEESAPKKKYTIEFVAGSEFCTASPKNIAPCLLDAVFSFLGLDQFFASLKHESKIQYDLQGIVRLLTYGRLLDPTSKIATMRQNEAYYRPLVKSSNPDNVYDALDVIYANRSKLLRRMNTRIASSIGRRADTVFYDVTNFFFETERPDPDVLDEDGEVIQKGLRKMGVSKENRKQPIVQAGLFLDDNGIPISLEVFPGNTLDHLTLRPAMKNTMDNLKPERFILVADRGMYNGTNMCHVLDQGHGYIVSKSLKKSAKKEREWVLDSEGYTAVGDSFKYKSRIVSRSVLDESGHKRTIQEKVVVYWSRAFYERERHENRSFLDFIEKLKENPSGFRVSAAQSRSLKRFLKKEAVHKETGEIVDTKKLISMIDHDKLTEFNAMMGYYQIVSSELDMDALEIVDKYHELTRIEDQFREMKGTLNTRPIYVSTPEHIHAHLLICFIALTMMRLMQHRIKERLPEEASHGRNWTYGIPGKRLSQALREWKVERLSQEYYRMVNTDSEDLKTILRAYGVSLPQDLLTAGQLRTLTTNFKLS
ncbi:MAG: IS1634 family transposase [Bacteroidales bacterium]|nr:IS1634 family transposase [Bacteroidales bacterium]